MTFIWENGIGSVSGTLTKDVNEPYSFALTSTIPTYRYLYYRAFAQFSGMIVTGFALSAKRVGGLVADGYICTFPKFAENELYFINKNNAAVSCYFWIRGKSGDSVNIPFIYPRISDESLASYVPDTIQQRIEDSYKEGYKAASDDLSLGVLKNAKIDLSLMFSDGITEKKKTQLKEKYYKFIFFKTLTYPRACSRFFINLLILNCSTFCLASEGSTILN